MSLDYALLDALTAVIRSGSFEKAARQIGVTPSAISQRVKLLEERIGSVLVIRGQPCTATDLGMRLVRHAEEVALLERTLGDDIGGGAVGQRRPTIRIAVNADSLATWFIQAMAAVPDCLFDLVLDDQEHSADWLRRGEVRAAVSGSDAPVQGCDCRPLGELRYIATASPDFMRRWFAEGVTAEGLAQAPALTFNAKDMLQARWIEAQIGETITPPTHWLPSSQAFVDAATVGLGWGLNPEILARDAIRQGRLVPLLANAPYDVPLYWHWSRSVATALQSVNRAVTETARAMLLPV
ncbi:MULTISPECIES: LysR family transcriptional regulator ArgP [Alphaproteobacteria]|nr:MULTISPECIES: LysR family transcriptional regulator ArgP [Alphaproteobacteria]